VNLAKLFGIESPADTDDSTDTASPPDVTQRLHDAHAAKATAIQALRDAEAATQRVQDVIADGELAKDTALEAADAAAASTRAWAIGGATGPSGDSFALAKAADAERAAIAARIRADGARAAMPEVRQLEENARLALNSADEAINEAVRQVLLVEVEPCFALIEHAYRETYEAHLRVHALARLLYGKWESFSDTTLSQRLSARLSSLMLRDPVDDELAPIRIQWADYARTLANPK
jgi:hypothetical protein